MATLKEKGHNIGLSKIILHKLNKNGGSKITSLKLADRELSVNQQERHFVADIRNSFQSRSKPTYGIFEDQKAFNGFHQNLQKYVIDEIDFLEFTRKSMEYYERIIKQSAPATGAFVVFSDYVYTDTSDRYLLIFSINNNQGYNLNEEQLTIEQILNLDLSKLDVAAMLNISKWQRYITEQDHGIKSYLSFIKGKKKLSDYFLEFIGCADKSTATDSSNQLLTALSNYFESLGYSKEEAKSKKKIVFDYCQSCMKEKSEVRLDQISYRLDPENPDQFSEFASAEEYAVGEIIKPDAKVLRNLYYIDYKSSDLTISFHQEMLSSKQIVYNSDSKTLTIKKLPEGLIKQLELNG